MQNQYATFVIGHYGPFADRTVVDLLIHDQVANTWAEQPNFTIGKSAIKMRYPVNEARVKWLAQCQGGQPIAEYLRHFNKEAA